VALAASVYLAVGVAGAGSDGQLLLGICLVPLWIVLFKVYGLYDRDANRINHSTVDDAPSLFHALVIGAVIFYVLSRILPTRRVSLAEGAIFFTAVLVSLLVLRTVARRAAQSLLPPERVLLLGGGPMAALLAAKMRQHDEYGVEPIGYLAPREDAEPQSLPYLGGLTELEAVCDRAHVDRVVIAGSNGELADIEDLIRRTAELEVRISVLPIVVDVLGPSIQVDDIEGVTVLGINPPTLTRSSRVLKRTMDMTIGTIALVAALPGMLLIALLIRASSAGPVLYSQERVGRGGKRFRIRKFRTMVIDADERVAELRASSAHPVWLLLEHDPRVTQIGLLLRHWSLDELPQLWNVIRGDMSLVGPRPMLPEIDEHILGWQRRRLDLTPGLTGFWQVLGRTNIPFEEMLKLDYLYVTNWSLWQDVRLLLRTVPAVLRQRGVN
jgi:exopolysaccharide biosynthesis polyprenyl glycosylphosphotransferase